MNPPGTQRPVVASYIATFLKPEMLHLYRQVTALRRWRPVVITQKREHADRFPFDDVVIRKKPATRWLRSVWCKRIVRRPIQAYRGEAVTIRDAAQRAGAAVLHVYFGHIGVYLLPLLRARRFPAVVSFHGADAGVDMDRPAFRDPMREMLGAVDRVLVRSESLAEMVARLGADPARVRLHRTGLPFDQFPVVPRTFPASGEWRLVQAGRLIAKKGFATTLRAFATFSAVFPKAHLTFAGAGPMEAELRALADNLGLTGRVEFVGFLGQAELARQYAAAHLFLHPSETGADGNVEGVPNALLEAMATGVPVVATRHGGIPEAVEDGVGGMLVAERDAAALAEAMARVASDPGLWEQLGTGAARMVRERFDLGVQAGILEGIYDEIAGGR